MDAGQAALACGQGLVSVDIRDFADCAWPDGVRHPRRGCELRDWDWSDRGSQLTDSSDLTVKSKIEIPP